MIFLLFLKTDEYFLIPAVMAPINPTAELEIPKQIATNEAIAKSETEPMTETKTRKCTKKSKALLTFLCFSLTNSICLKDRFLFSFLIFVFKVLIYYLVILLMIIRKKQIVII